MKRCVDITAATAGLVALSPLLVGIAAAIGLTMGRPVLFRQWRPGRGGRPFEILKFRTMLDTRDAHGQLLPDVQRITWLGRCLRNTSLDELPELFNVLRGDMSLVGPRPLLMRYLERYSPQQARRHEVRPGITGLAQVSGRNAISWEAKFALDVWYIEHWSPLLDCRILFKTFKLVLRRDGVDAAPDVTMPEFMGNGLRTAAVDKPRPDAGLASGECP